MVRNVTLGKPATTITGGVTKRNSTRLGTTGVTKRNSTRRARPRAVTQDTESHRGSSTTTVAAAFGELRAQFPLNLGRTNSLRLWPLLPLFHLKWGTESDRRIKIGSTWWNSILENPPTHNDYCNVGYLLPLYLGVDSTTQCAITENLTETMLGRLAGLLLIAASANALSSAVCRWVIFVLVFVFSLSVSHIILWPLS